MRMKDIDIKRAQSSAMINKVKALKEKGYNYYEISKILKISESSVRFYADHKKHICYRDPKWISYLNNHNEKWKEYQDKHGWDWFLSSEPSSMELKFLRGGGLSKKALWDLYLLQHEEY